MSKRKRKSYWYLLVGEEWNSEAYEGNDRFKIVKGNSYWVLKGGFEAYPNIGIYQGVQLVNVGKGVV